MNYNQDSQEEASVFDGLEQILLMASMDKEIQNRFPPKQELDIEKTAREILLMASINNDQQKTEMDNFLDKKFEVIQKHITNLASMTYKMANELYDCVAQIKQSNEEIRKMISKINKRLNK